MVNINNDRCFMGRNVICDNMLVKFQRRFQWQWQIFCDNRGCVIYVFYKLDLIIEDLFMQFFGL